MTFNVILHVTAESVN